MGKQSVPRREYTREFKAEARPQRKSVKSR